MAFPRIPTRTEEAWRKAGLGAVWSWFQEKVYAFMDSSFNTGGDLTCRTPGKGLVLTTPDGTKQYKVTISNAGALTITLVT